MIKIAYKAVQRDEPKTVTFIKFKLTKARLKRGITCGTVVNDGWNAVNSAAVLAKDQAIRAQIIRHYNGYLQHVKLESTISRNLGEAVSGNRFPLDKLAELQSESASQFNRIATVVNEVRDFAQQNRIVIALYRDCKV